MSNGPAAKRIAGPLDPTDRVSEALFGLIMVLTFTCSISAADPGREDVRTMLFGALSCNFVWGIIDAVLYLMGCLAERGQGIGALRSVRSATSPLEGQRAIAAALPAPVASALRPEELERIRQELSRLPEPPRRPRLSGRDWLAALGVFLWVVVITIPVAIPFVVIQDAHRALRVSNLIAVVLLFVAGHAFGRHAGLRPVWTGVVMVLVGSALVAATIALGG